MVIELASLLDLFKEKIIKIVDGQIDEVTQLLDKGFNIYTQNWCDKINNVKTFLFYENPVDFDTVYLPLSVRFSEQSKRIVVNDPVLSLFRNVNFITILGHAGSGKTMLMKHCFLTCLKKGAPIPIIIELRKLNEYNGTLEDYIYNIVFKFDLAKNISILRRLFSEGVFVFFLDGYDEISLVQKEKRTSEIEEFVDRYNKNYFLLTSRPGANAEMLSRFRSYHMCELNDDEIKKFVNIHVALMNGDRFEGESVAKKMLSSIFSEKNSPFRDYLKNPLLLSMFILTFKMNPEIPSRRSDFYYNVFDTLYSKHDVKSKSGGFIHDRKCKLEKEDYQNILKWFCYLSYFQYRYVFDERFLDETFQKIKRRLDLNYTTSDLIYDLTVSISILLLDGLDYNFPHRSMQEYFAAYLISSLPEELKRYNIYGDKLIKVRRTSDYNFWSLCEEMDGYCFKRYFILPQLRALYDTIMKKRKGMSQKLSILVNFIENFNLAVGIDNNRVVSVRYTNNEYYSILRYTRVMNPINVVFDNLDETICQKIVEYYEKSEGPIHPYYELNNLNSLNIVFGGSSLEKEINCAFQKIKPYTDKLEQELNQYTSMDVDLLNMV